MRKFLIKNFILTQKNDIRLAIFNFLCLFVGLLPGVFLGWSLTTILLTVFPLFSLGVTFLYFTWFPANWNELNDEQKWNYGWAINNNKSSKIKNLTPKQQVEWERLDKIYGNK